MSDKTVPPIRIRFNIDRGGTFTDIYAEIIGETERGGTGFRVLKLLSEDDSYPNAPCEGIRRILNEVLGLSLKIGEKLPLDSIEWVRMGTTVATNALLERHAIQHRRGAAPPKESVLILNTEETRTFFVALVITKGFADLLEIGNQSRPDIFDLRAKKPEILYDRSSVVEVRERVFLRPDLVASEIGTASTKGKLLVTASGDVIEVFPPPKEGDAYYHELVDSLKVPLQAGVSSVAVVFLHSYAHPEHELAIGELCRKLGYSHVSLSSQLSPVVKAVPRGHTATLNAFLTPFLEDYIASFKRGFDLTSSTSKLDLSFMKSDGGLCPVDRFVGYVSLLSGPAGGVVGYSQTKFDSDQTSDLIAPKRQLVGLDMGGTSTDVSRVEGRDYQFVSESEIDGVFVQATQLDIQTVAAGGGSVLHFESGNMGVGPDSVGANPGPICYGKGGKRLAVTDANFILGRIPPKYFPLMLDSTATQLAFAERADQIRHFAAEKGSTSTAQPSMTVHEVAMGYLDLANSRMASAIEKVTEQKGFDVHEHTLVVFGGAGPQHACAIARVLGIESVIINRFSSVLSAYGLGLADEKEEVIESCKVDFYLNSENVKTLTERFNSLSGALFGRFKGRFAPEHVEFQRHLNLRYEGTDTVLSILEPSDGNYLRGLETAFFREFGFTMESTPVIVESLHLVALAHASHIEARPIPASTRPPVPAEVVQCYFTETRGFTATPLYELGSLGAGDGVAGPAMIVDPKYYMTIVVEPGCQATVTKYGHVSIHVPHLQPTSPPSHSSSSSSTPQAARSGVVERSLYVHKFMSIAEQMGVALQRTAKSVNIKERLDFSCALFNHQGALVANAPHLPVHLGAMQAAVKFQISHLGSDWHKGDVILSNHPAAGGSHLPDFTVITPVFYEGPELKEAPTVGVPLDLTRPVFYVASRAHHAEIGGITPGSMPATSKRLVEEGAATKSLKISIGGKFQKEAVLAFLAAPAQTIPLPGEPAPSGSRRPDDNVADLKAQIAANKRGIDLVQELIRRSALSHVLYMMGQVQEAAETAVRDLLKRVYRERLSTSSSSSPSSATLDAQDWMDNGLKISLKIQIDPETGSAIFDFSGTSQESFGNLNAPPSVTASAVIYTLRCLVDREIPLNDGCLRPIKLILPPRSFLSPNDTAAVVGGNVLTSQRVTDIILMAFGAQANSQGCMNNFTFGGEGSRSYYETIAGGSGAGPTWTGQSGVQVHMTNTRITDAEILERRFPVRLRQFGLRKGSGGKGYRRGGDGVVRIMQFMKPLTVSVLSERRTLRPNGLQGGGKGKRGKNLLLKTYVGWEEGGEIDLAAQVDLGGKNTIRVDPGDAVLILTPGGGGFGVAQ